MNKKNFSKQLVFAAVGIFLLSACATSRTGKARQAMAAISSTSASAEGSGTITFTQKKKEVEMNLSLSFPDKAGRMVAVHIHEHGDCGEGGNAAHGHWNPTNSKHGRWGSDQFHLGDIGNVQLDKSGKGSLTIKTDKWSVGTGAANDVVGHGIIVHAGADDYITQPTGNAGGRIGCGVIQLVNSK